MKALGQGRPLGLLWAWLLRAQNSRGALCGLGGHDHGKYFPPFQERREGRQDAERVMSEESPWRKEERPKDAPLRDHASGEPHDLY